MPAPDGTVPSQSGGSKDGAVAEIPADVKKRLASLEYQQKQVKQAITKLKRDTNQDRERNKKSHEEQQVTNKINAKEITYNRHDVEQLQTHMDEAFDEIYLNRGKMREAAAPINTMWNTFSHVASHLHPRVQGRLGGKFALPAITARAKAVAAIKDADNEEDDENDDQYEDIDDDVEIADDSGVQDWAEASEHLQHADDSPRYIVNNPPTSGGEGRRRRKRGGKGKGRGKKSRRQ